MRHLAHSKRLSAITNKSTSKLQVRRNRFVTNAEKYGYKVFGFGSK